MKIALISSTQHNMIGGTETYARNLIDALSSQNNITEFPIQVGTNIVSRLYKNVAIDNRLLGWKPNDMVWGGTYTKRNMEYIFSNFDIVVWNNCLPSRKWVKNKKSILIQHESVSWYKFSGKGFWLAVGGFFSYIFFGISGTIGNPFKKANASVFFDKTTSCETNNKHYYCRIPSAYNNYSSDVRSGTIWLGRIEDKIKNIKDLIYISNKVNVDIYGDGPDMKMLNKLNNLRQRKGFINKDNVPRMLAKYKSMVMTSNWEGFPFVMVEAMHAGTPVVFYDTFDSSKLFKSSGSAFIVKDREEAIKKIKWINNLSNDEYNKISKKARKFARENFTIEKFSQVWNEIVLEVSNHDQKKR